MNDLSLYRGATIWALQVQGVYNHELFFSIVDFFAVLHFPAVVLLGATGMHTENPLRYPRGMIILAY